MTKQVSLFVNDQPITLEYFVQGFIDHTIGGILAALEETGEIKNADIAIEGDNVAVNLNNSAVPTNPFVQKIIRSTVAGMVATLKGVGEINKVKIHIDR